MLTPVVNAWFSQAFYQEIPDAFWRLNDGVGATIADDQTVNAYQGAVLGGVTFAQAGWPGDGDTAALFNGTTGYINVGNVAALAYAGRFTIIAAFKTSDGSHFLAIAGKCVSGTKAGWGLALDSGKVRFFAYTSTPTAVWDVSSASTYADGNWHLAIATYDLLNNSVKMYIDGTQDGSATPTAGLYPDVNSARLTIGAFDNAGGGASFFNGSLDEISLYPYHVRAAQVTAAVAARNVHANTPGLAQARAGLMRSGAERSFYYRSRSIVLLNGVDVAKQVWKGTLKTKEILNEQPDTARLTLFAPGNAGGFYSGGFYSGGFYTGFSAPTYGQTVILSDGASDNSYLGGSIVRVRRRSVKSAAGLRDTIQLFDLEITDWTWLLNRRTVTAVYPAGTLAHVAFIDIINRFTSGFTTRNVKTSSSALTATLVLKGVKVATALSRVTSTQPNWSWYPDANCDLHCGPPESSQRPKAIVPGNYTYDQLDYTLDITQIRTRCIGEGGGAATTAPVSAGASSIPVEDCGWYLGVGGSIVSPEGDIITYTGRSASSGPGNLTGVPASGTGSITQPIKQGEVLNVWVIVDDTAAQAALGLLERDKNNNTTDGIHEQYLPLPNATVAMVTQTLTSELTAYKNANVLGTLWSRDRFMHVAKVLTIALPVRGLTVDVTVQQVERSLLTVNQFQCRVTFATTWRNFVDVLKRIARAN